MAESAEPVQDKVALATLSEFPSYPLAASAAWAISSLKAPFYEPTSRSPVDVMAVIDKSGSMSGGKLKLVKETLLFVLEQLKECDRLGLVTYDTNVYNDFGLTRMDAASKEKTKRTIEALVTGSSTNLCGGLLSGMQQVLSCTGERAQVQSVLLLTDGLANQGITRKEGILEEMRKLQNPPEGKGVAAKKFEGTVYTFGFGSDHNADMLEGISTQGGGVYYYIDSPEKIPESFADCLGGLLSVMGQNLLMKLEALGGSTISELHANRTVNWTTPNKCCEIPMGDIQSEEERDIVLKLALPQVDAPCADNVLRASLSYFNVISSVMDSISHELSVERIDGEPDRSAHNTKVDLQRNRIVATAAMKNAEPLADQGKLDEAKSILTSAIATIESSATADDDFNKFLLQDLKRCLESMKSRAEYHGHGKLFMKNRMQSHAVQRSNYVDEGGLDAYQNMSKVAMKRKAKK